MELDDFIVNDEDFEESTGINNISRAFQKVFDNIISVAEYGSRDAACGNVKGIASTIEELTHKVAKLVEISTCALKIVGPTGRVYNLFGSDGDDDIGHMTEEQAISTIEAIINSENEITISDARKYKSEHTEEETEENNDSNTPIDDNIDW